MLDRIKDWWNGLPDTTVTVQIKHAAVAGVGVLLAGFALHAIY